MAKLQMLERLLYFSLTKCCELFRLNESQMSFYFMDLLDFIAMSATKPEAISVESSEDSESIILADRTDCRLLSSHENIEQQR